MGEIQQHLMAAIQNKELQLQEQKPLKSGDEYRFDIAISTDGIKKRPITELENVLKLIMLKVGLRSENIPSPEEKMALIDHILSVYGNHTIEEVRLAFDMALSGKLKLSVDDITCYENFSCAYFSKIMNAYRVWSSQVYKEKPNTVKMIEEKKELTDEEWNEWLLDMRNYDFTLLPCAAYEYLVKKELINLSVEQKHEYMEKSIAYMINKLEAGTREMLDFLVMKSKGIYSKEVTSSLITISKRMAVRDYLNPPTNVNT